MKRHLCGKTIAFGVQIDIKSKEIEKMGKILNIKCGNGSLSKNITGVE